MKRFIAALLLLGISHANAADAVDTRQFERIVPVGTWTNLCHIVRWESDWVFFYQCYYHSSNVNGGWQGYWDNRKCMNFIVDIKNALFAEPYCRRLVLIPR